MKRGDNRPYSLKKSGSCPFPAEPGQAQAYYLQVHDNLPWANLAATENPDTHYVTALGDDPRIAHPDATSFTDAELRLETWSRYRSKFRYHDWWPEKEGVAGQWKRRVTNNPVNGCAYAEECRNHFDAVSSNNPPPRW